jgi:hypothetical protein
MSKKHYNELKKEYFEGEFEDDPEFILANINAIRRDLDLLEDYIIEYEEIEG